MLELRELHLQLAFVGLRALRENAQDQLGAVEHGAAELFFEVALLAGLQVVVEDHRRRVQLVGGVADFLDLAAAGVEPGIGTLALALHHPVAPGARAFGEALDFLDCLLVVVVAEIQADEHGGGRVGGPAGYYLGI